MKPLCLNPVFIVGLREMISINYKEQKQFEKIMKESGIIVSYLKDYEKAKEWVLK